MGVTLVRRSDRVPGEGIFEGGDQWRAWAEGEPGTADQVEAYGQFHYQALNNLADKLRELRGPTTG
jgi:hypothetical protein